MRRLLVAVLIVVPACTGATVPTTMTPAAASTIPPAQLVDGGLIPIDPATLVPVPNAEPLVVSLFHRGVVSSNGRWAAIESISAHSTLLTIADLQTVEVVNQIDDPTCCAGLAIHADGTTYWLAPGESTRLVRAGLEGPPAVVFDDFPPGYSTWDGIELFADGRIGLAGQTLAQEDQIPSSLALIIDLAAGTNRQYPLPDVVSDELGDEFARPDSVWDMPNDRLLVVEASRDVITEVRLETGEQVEHPWQRPEALLDHLMTWLMPPAQAKGPTTGVSREAVLLDGKLFVVTTVDSVVNDVWTSDPEELAVIDTDTWEVETLDVAVNVLHPSSDESLLLTQGVSHSDLLAEGRPGPLYIVDPATLEVIADLDLGGDHLVDVSFSADGTLAYAHYWDELDTIDLIDLSQAQIVGSVTFREMSLIGPAGLLAFHVDG